VRRRRIAANFAQLFEWYEAGLLAPLVSRVLPLEDAATALSLRSSRQVIGKIVLTTRNFRS
jgi:NADPH2:quinone reductase